MVAFFSVFIIPMYRKTTLNPSLMWTTQRRNRALSLVPLSESSHGGWAMSIDDRE